ncbi:MAG: beta-glucuronidase [Bacteroidaceae bacterium]|nr:beta-glucuronidase [Bacteroidaceae bacterium]
MRRILFFASLGLTLCSLASASNSSNIYPLIQNVPGRELQSLDGTWKYILDLYELGFYNYRMDEDRNGWFRDAHANRPEDLVEYNFDTAPTLHVPGDWNTQKEDLLNFEGNIWYRRQFECHPDAGKRRFIHFDAVNYECQVYLNGRKIGVHEGGFSPFNIEITDRVQDGTNTLILKVDNRRRLEGVPTVNTDWHNYGGITRQVNVISVPKVFIRDYFIQLKKGTSNIVAGWVQMDGAGNSTVTIEIPELKVKQQVSTDADGYGTFEFKCKPTLWSPENPKLYAVKLSSDSDCVEDEIGLRTIETRGKEIYLNGNKLFCRGISIHEEAPLRPGRAWSKEDAAILLGWAKEMNCNFVRLAHYQHNENMIRTAERMGLLVWSEIPCYWTIQWENEGTLETAQEQIEAMIGRDKNRTNIIIWSIANETPISEPRNLFLRKLADKVRSMDDTRLVAAAMEKKELQGGVMTLDDPMSKYLDVLSFNQYVGWYDGLPEKCDRVHWEFSEDKPVFISEFGGGALQGYHGPENQRWTEEFQADLYRHSVKMLENMEGLSGCTPWILTDFRSPRRVLTDIQDGYNRKGLISDRGIRKAAFYIMKDWYGSFK